MPQVYIYVVARDFGFAPNPFHGTCTLATCKPVIRRTAQKGDWIIGMGGRALNAVGRCIYAMRVTDTISFDDYWAAPEFRSKRPVRNGSRKKIIGDNIYHHIEGKAGWQQEDSHHSQPDGTPDLYNIQHDTQTNRILISSYFYYFGASAPLVPPKILKQMGFHNGVGHRVFEVDEAQPLLSWLDSEFKNKVGCVLGDPFQFARSNARYSKKNDRII